MPKRKVKIGNQEFMAESIEFHPTEIEKWNIYALEDGTTLKVKVIVAEVLRVEGVYDQNNDPVYTLNSSVVASSVSPENLKKKG